ncbi:MAG: hypothetical protein ACO1NW_01330 [Chitinophagaceae bacterium]
MKQKLLFFVCLISFVRHSVAQEIPVKSLLSREHPRYITGNGDKSARLRNLVATESWAASILEQAKKGIETHVERHRTDSTWMPSRLQLFWKTKHKDIFIKGGTYDHASGEAPVPTVKFPGMRGGIPTHATPKLEDLLPYMDDPRGLYLVNKATGKMEWADISKTGGIIEGINNSIMRMAYTASVVYFVTTEEKYAKFAFDLFDTYMTGMVYRSVPKDISNGHHQTLAGLSSFEVIQEVAILNSLTGCFDFLNQYIRKHAPEKVDVYTGVFRKWADLQIANGVAFNNWNLMQARNVLNIALMLEDDADYADKKGNRYYTNYILNTTSQRQWSLRKVVNEGFDPVTGLWNESAGYSMVVLNDVIGFVEFFDDYYNLDLVSHLPILKKAVTAIPQYLFPNGFYAGFGDSHYGRISLNTAYQMLANAQKNGKKEQAQYFSKYIRTISAYYKERGVVMARDDHGHGNQLNDLFKGASEHKPDTSFPAGKISDYITQVFSSDHVSLFTLRNGLDPENGLMMAMSGSKGNHMHAGGIAMELYGKGYVLGPESGIGTNYFQADYAEYYSQFPAHNTVAVDGISAYPVMKSNHAFEVKAAYPEPGLSEGYFSKVSFGSLYFREPETNSDQLRTVGAIRTSDTSGYYIDIFRSARKDGKDKFHDYFYHNMGQELELLAANGSALALKPTDQLSFGGGHLFAYDYIFDKKSITTDHDIRAVFKLAIPGKDAIEMRLWMKGEKNRELIAAKSPKSTAIDRMGLPKEITELPLPTLVARQNGEAWTKPFVVVFQPASTGEKNLPAIQAFSGGNDSFTGIEIAHTNGSKQYVFSNADSLSEISHRQFGFKGTYAVVSTSGKEDEYLFLGNGYMLRSGNFSVASRGKMMSASFSKENDGWYYVATEPSLLTVPASWTNGTDFLSLRNGNETIQVKGKKTKGKGEKLLVFELPALPYQKIK